MLCYAGRSFKEIELDSNCNSRGMLHNSRGIAAQQLRHGCATHLWTDQCKGWHAEEFYIPVTPSYNSNMARWVQWRLHLHHRPCAHRMSHQTLAALIAVRQHPGEGYKHACRTTEARTSDKSAQFTAESMHGKKRRSQDTCNTAKLLLCMLAELWAHVQVLEQHNVWLIMNRQLAELKSLSPSIAA